MELADWDRWRADYDHLTLEQQKDFYDRVWVDHPVQQAWDLAPAAWLFAQTPDVNVLELGGWGGELANQLLDRFPIRTWTNFEVCRLAAESPACQDSRYQCICPNSWFWESKHSCDVFVASHVIEHVKAIELERIVQSVSCDYALIDAPIPQDTTNMNWTGYLGSHVLEIGWEQVTAMFADVGMKPMGYYHETVHLYQRA